MCLWLAFPAATFAEHQNRCVSGDGSHIRKVCLSVEHGRRRYGHDVLGQTPEWNAMTVFWGRQGRARIKERRATSTVKMPGHIFEDIAPRLVDLNGDGLDEIIVVQSSDRQGARLMIISTGRALTVAATPYIGRRHRWLAPIGAADLDGDGRIEIAYIDRPHLAKTLRIWRFANGRLHHVTDSPGLSNHKIGWDHIPGGIRSCASAPEIITANKDWSRIIASRLDKGIVRQRDIGAYTGPASLNAARNCR